MGVGEYKKKRFYCENTSHFRHRIWKNGTMTNLKVLPSRGLDSLKGPRQAWRKAINSITQVQGYEP